MYFVVNWNVRRPQRRRPFYEYYCKSRK